MITGFNTEERYADEYFHIQTEDRGKKAARIDTIVYRRGGSVVHRKKISYQDILNCDFLEDVVREIMQETHARTINEVRKGLWARQPALVPDQSFRDTVKRYLLQPGALTGLTDQSESEF